MAPDRRRYMVLPLILLLLTPWGCATSPRAEEPARAAMAEPPPHARQAAADDTADGSIAARVLAQRDRIVFEEDGTFTHTQTRTVAIDSEQAAEAMSSFGIRWSPWLEARPVVRVSVETADGRRFELDPATIDDAPARETSDGLLSDARVLTVTVPGLRAGGRIHAELMRRRTPSLMTAGVSLVVPLIDTLPLEGVVVEIEHPKSLPLRWEISSQDITEEREERGDHVVLTLSSGPRPALKAGEAFAPIDVTSFPAIYLSTGRSWEDLAAVYTRVVEDQLAGAELDEVVAPLAQPGMSRDDIVAALLAWLHEHVRYTGLELGEAAVIPRNPSETLSRGYGDCKDQATLLVALLRAAGIEAHVALLRSRPGFEVRPDLPALDVFDHAIVHVPGDVPLWIDTTHPYLPAGALPDRDRGRLALIAAPGVRELVTTPARLEGSASLYQEVRQVQMAEAGPAQVTERTTATGALDELQRLMVGMAETDALRSQLEQYVEDTYGAEELEALHVGDPHDLATPFLVELIAAGATWAQTEDVEGWVVLDEGPLFAQGPVLEMLAAQQADLPRTQVLEWPIPHTAEIRYEISPPAGFEPVDIPPEETRALGAAELSRRFQWTGTQLVATLRLTTGPRTHTAAEANALASALKDWEQEPRQILHFKHRGAALIDRGEVAGGLALLAAQAEADPRDAIARARLARALVDVGMGLEARRLAEEAAALAPGSVITQRARGYVALHDPIGRVGAAGMQGDVAREAFQACVALAPDDRAMRANLAQVLQQLASGAEATPALQEESARLWREVLANDETSDELRETAADALIALHLERPSPETLDALRDHLPPGLREHLLALALAGDGDVEGADRLLQSAGRSAEERADELIDISGALLAALRYEEARSSLDQAARVAPAHRRVDVARRQAGLEGVRPLGERSPDLRTPEGVVEAAIIAHLTGDDDALGQLIHTALAPSSVGPEAKRGALSVLGPRGIYGTGSLVQRLGYDFLVGHSRLSATGSEQRGYRVSLLIGSDEALPELIFYVVREGRRWVIRGDSLKGAALAEIAEERLLQGDVEGARRWIEWAVADQTHGLSMGGSEPPLPMLWRSGYRDTAAGLEILAAAARAGSGATERSVSMLEAERASAAAPAVRAALDRAILESHLGMQHHAQALAALDRATKTTGDSRVDLLVRLGLLTQLERHDLAQTTAERYTADHPDDISALMWQASQAQASGDLASAARHWERVLERSPREDVALNNRAWLAPFLGEVSEADVALARRAVEIEGGGADDASLHTLAVLLAERGEAGEAMDVLRAALDARDGGLEPHDWYVVGRIAEVYGLAGAARDAYERSLADGDDPTSVSHLATRRMAVLTASK